MTAKIALKVSLLTAFLCSASAEIIGTVTVSSDQAKIYWGEEVVGTARNGEVLEVSQIQGDWYGVLHPKGWIHRKDAQFQKKAETKSQSPRADSQSQNPKQKIHSPDPREPDRVAPVEIQQKPIGLDMETLVRDLRNGGDVRREAISKILGQLQGEVGPASLQEIARPFRKELTPLLDALAEMKLEDATDNEIQTVVRIFALAGSPSPPAMLLARRLSKLKGETNLKQPMMAALGLAKKAGHPDKEFRDSILSQLKEMPDPAFSQAVEYLRQWHSKDAVVTTTLVELLAVGKVADAESLVLSLSDCRLSREAAEKVLHYAVDGLNEKKNENAALGAIRLLRHQPLAFAGALSVDDQARLMRVMEEGELPVSDMAAQMLALGGSLNQGKVTEAILRAFTKGSVRENRVLLAMAFAPVKRSQPTLSNQGELRKLVVDQLKNGRINESAGLALSSIAIRLSKDPKQGIVEVVTAQGGRPIDELYWKPVLRTIPRPPEGPKDLKEQWLRASNIPEKPGKEGSRPDTNAEVMRFRKEAVLNVLENFPNSPDAVWIVERALDENIARHRILSLLWEYRKDAAHLANAEGLLPWLEDVAAKHPNRDTKETAAGILVSVYGQKEKALGIIEQLVLGATGNSARLWTRGIDVLIEFAPDSPALKQYRQSLESPNQGDQTGQGDEFMRWLFDLRMGKPVEMPDLESFVASLNSSYGASVPRSLASSAGVLSREHLAALRSPALAFAVRQDDLLKLLLGILDGLDLSMP